MQIPGLHHAGAVIPASDWLLLTKLASDWSIRKQIAGLRHAEKRVMH